MSERVKTEDGWDVLTYVSGAVCPTCGIPESYTIHQPPRPASLADSGIAYSCPHYQALRKSSPCKYCGKPDTPVRQVPVPIPVSDCYCDDCREKCREEYAPYAPPKPALRNLEERGGP